MDRPEKRLRSASESCKKIQRELNILKHIVCEDEEVFEVPLSVLDILKDSIDSIVTIKGGNIPARVENWSTTITIVHNLDDPSLHPYTLHPLMIDRVFITNFGPLPATYTVYAINDSIEGRYSNFKLIAINPPESGRIDMTKTKWRIIRYVPVKNVM